MRHIIIPPAEAGENRRLPFYLAAEEWVARRLPAGDYFFSWRVAPTVICGRNQEIDKEVDLDYCRRHAIDVVRRRSGGGAVFADMQNFMFSYITDGDDVTGEFARYTSMIADSLRRLGIDATATGRNDITVGGRKVAGNAFYHIPGRCIAHGTMLYDFDPTHIAGALTPSKAKLESKGVKSVPMRVTGLAHEGIGLGPEAFERFIIDNITDGDPYRLTPDDLLEVREIERGYYAPSFMRIGGKRKGSGADTVRTSRSRIDGLGEFCIDCTVDPATATLSHISISGDFFMSADVETLLCRPLEGVAARREAIAAAVAGLHPERVIPGLSAGSLTDMICESGF